MTDPNDITQASAVVESAGGPGGIIGMILGALTVLGGLWRIVFGTKAERQDAAERAAEIALRAAEHADERAERADEQSAVHKRERLTCEEQLREMRAEIRLMRADLDSLRAENKALREQTALQQRAINRLLAGSTPPEGIHPDEVRAGVAAQEDTGP